MERGIGRYSYYLMLWQLVSSTRVPYQRSEPPAYPNVLGVATVLLANWEPFEMSAKSVSDFQTADGADTVVKTVEQRLLAAEAGGTVRKRRESLPIQMLESEVDAGDQASR